MKSLYTLRAAAFGCALLLTGCTPADPLDWKVRAKTPEQYVEWMEENIPLMDEDLSGHLNYAFATLSATTDTPHLVFNQKQYRNPNNAFCMQISGLTVRQIIIEGCRAANITILQELNKESEKLRALLASHEELELGSPYAERLERAITYRRKVIDNCHATIERNNALLAKIIRPVQAP